MTEDDFELVPAGFEGSFQVWIKLIITFLIFWFLIQGFNVTQMLEENKEDEIFQEFETLYTTVNSNLGRKQFSDEQKEAIKKVLETASPRTSI